MTTVSILSYCSPGGSTATWVGIEPFMTDEPLSLLEHHTGTSRFDQFASHLDTITEHDSEPVEPNPDITCDDLSPRRVRADALPPR